ncbi:acyl carrier protein [Kitasatospora sp. NPDC059646]|uniref:acyl carrier protein n=1 Tax=Kitasatospora sp. NPDC059646 TaxID=3346893 RepID=UPI0036AE4EA0
MSTGSEPRFGRPEAMAMLARYGDRSPDQVDDQIGSLELTWLIAEAEQTYGVQLDLDDDRLDTIRTVDDAVAALGAQLDRALRPDDPPRSETPLRPDAPTRSEGTFRLDAGAAAP